jgi:hypothetical protein
MIGFEWSPVSAPALPETEEGGDGWCVRNAFCELLGWERGSAEWGRFVEWPQGEDMPRLAAHLGMKVLRVEVAQEWNELIGKWAHPGIAFFDLPADQMSHVVYVPDVRWLLHHWPTPDGQPAERGSRQPLIYGWPLDNRYLERHPVLRAVIVDEQQPLRPVPRR